MSEEKKVKCPVCGLEDCLEEDQKTMLSWLCLDCGFTSVSEYKHGSKLLRQVMSNSPQIVIDLKVLDEERNIFWFPSVINIPSKGIIYPNGTMENWLWFYAPIVDIPEKDQQNFPVPGADNKFYDKRLAVEQAKSYSRENFREALTDMGGLAEAKLDLQENVKESSDGS